jgi:hypothetical protein
MSRWGEGWVRMGKDHNSKVVESINSFSKNYGQFTWNKCAKF